MENKIGVAKEANQCSPHERCVGGSLFRIYATDTQIEYVDRVLEGSLDTITGHTEETIEIVCIGDTKLSEEVLYRSINVKNLSESLITGDIEGGKFISLKSVFTDVLMSKTDDTPLTNISISQNPEYGAITFIKSYLLNKYVNSQDALVFHAGSMSSLNGQYGFAISALNHHINNGDNSGKTTAILASCTGENARFAYSSNDEVILTVSSDTDEVRISPFPSQITIRGKSLETLRTDRVNLNLEKWSGTDNITGQSVNVVTPKGLVEAGYQVLLLNSQGLDWCFIELDPNRKDYSCIEAGAEVSKQLFRGAVSKRRMNQALNPLFLGETSTTQTYDPIAYQPKVDKIFNQLAIAGTRFYVLQVGPDRNKLNEIFCKLKK